MAEFLFVHGAFQGGWVWRQVADFLQQQGHTAHTPTFSGCGYRYWPNSSENDVKTFVETKASYLDIVSGCTPPPSEDRRHFDLNTSIAELSNYLEFEELDDCVLVGHSFSGMICGALMMRFPQRIRQAIFVDAVIPQSNQSFVEIAGEPFEKMLKKHQLDDEMVRPWPVQVFGVGEQKADWFKSRLCPFPIRSFHTTFPGQFDPSVRPTSLITCLQTTSPFIRAMAKKAQEISWPVHELDSGHCPMITCPEKLVDLLTTIVKKKTVVH